MQNIDIFPWDNHFNTGIEVIDNQHRKLVIILNRLATMVAYQSANDKLNDIYENKIVFQDKVEYMDKIISMRILLEPLIFSFAYSFAS